MAVEPPWPGLNSCGMAATSLMVTGPGQVTIRDVAAIPQLFSPGQGGSTAIGYYLSRQAIVEVDIYRFRQAGGRLEPDVRVRRLFSGTQSVGTQRVVWDGKDDAGAGVLPDPHFIRIHATDPEGAQAYGSAVALVDTGQAPLITEVA